MSLNLNKNLKLYYSIGEVAQMLGLNDSTLRYWEQEFPFLRPKVNGPSKVRQYTEKDIDQIRLINNLVRVRGFKIAAAKKLIYANPKGVDKRADVLESLINIRKELQSLKKQLDYLQ
jgi:DNA-binding transcriptional MerR regulator